VRAKVPESYPVIRRKTKRVGFVKQVGFKTGCPCPVGWWLRSWLSVYRLPNFMNIHHDMHACSLWLHLWHRNCSNTTAANRTWGEFTELLEKHVAVGDQRQLVSFHLVGLRLYNHVAQLLFLPQPVHAVHDTATAFHILRVDRIVRAVSVSERVAEVAAAVGGDASARHRRAGLPRLPTLATVGARATRTTVHRRHRHSVSESRLAGERSDAGAVELSDDLVARRRPRGTSSSAASSADTVHRRGLNSPDLPRWGFNFSDVVLRWVVISNARVQFTWSLIFARYWRRCRHHRSSHTSIVYAKRAALSLSSSAASSSVAETWRLDADVIV